MLFSMLVLFLVFILYTVIGMAFYDETWVKLLGCIKFYTVASLFFYKPLFTIGLYSFYILVLNKLKNSMLWPVKDVSNALVL